MGQDIFPISAIPTGLTVGRENEKNGAHFRQYINSINILTSAGAPVEVSLFRKADPSGIPKLCGVLPQIGKSKRS